VRARFIEAARLAQLQEISAGIQTFLNAGFLSAVELEFVVMIEKRVFIRYKGGAVPEFQEFCS
jgi:hypothetical protein